MGNYCKLINIVVVHDYFPDGTCSVLQFKPTPSTERLIQRNNLLIKPMVSGFSILGDYDESEIIDEPLTLQFYAYSTDSCFSLYTAQQVSEGEQLYFSTQIAHQNSLMPTGFDNDSVNIQVPNDRQFSKPVFIVDIYITPDAFIAFENDTKTFILHLPARAVHWKYYFLGDLAKYDLEIIDSECQSINIFSKGSGAETRFSKAFVSQVPILLSALPSRKFQLKDKGNAGKTLIKHLANAGVTRLGKDFDQEGKEIIVAEIYVNQ